MPCDVRTVLGVVVRVQHDLHLCHGTTLARASDSAAPEDSLTFRLGAACLELVRLMFLVDRPRRYTLNLKVFGTFRFSGLRSRLFLNLRVSALQNYGTVKTVPRNAGLTLFLTAYFRTFLNSTQSILLK